MFGLSGRAGGGLNVGLDRFDASWVVVTKGLGFRVGWVLLMGKILQYPL